MDLSQLPACYYRATTKAIVFDSGRRLLVQVNSAGEHELPGGGLEYGEEVSEALSREVNEELGVDVANVGEFMGLWYGTHSELGSPMLRLAFRVTLRSNNFKPSDGMTAALWVTKDEFDAIDWKFEGDKPGMTKVIWGEK